MFALIKKWNNLSLVVRIVIGLILGATLGGFCPKCAVFTLLGSVFVGALKAIAPILVFVLVCGAIANAKGGIGSRFRTVVILYVLSTLCAALVAVVGSALFPVTMNLKIAGAIGNPPSGISAVLVQLIQNAVSNPFRAIIDANYIGILFWSVIFGFAFKKIAHHPTNEMLSTCGHVISMAVHWIIQLAPFGIMGLVFEAVADNGISIFYNYGKLLCLLVGSMAFVAFIVNPLISTLYMKKNAYPLLFRCLKGSGIMAFFTRSSAANIPVNMALCERLGLERDFYSVSIPLGATINMNGAAITITVMTLAVANTLGIQVDIPTALMLSAVATLSACGTSGVAGGSLLLIPLACSLFNISNDIAMQAVAVGFILGVIQDSCETALNSSGDVFFAATAEFHDNNKTAKSA